MGIRAFCEIILALVERRRRGEVRSDETNLKPRPFGARARHAVPLQIQHLLEKQLLPGSMRLNRPLQSQNLTREFFRRAAPRILWCDV